MYCVWCKDTIWSYFSHLNGMNVLPPPYKSVLCVSLFENSCSVFENWCPLLVFPAREVTLSFLYAAWKLLTCKHILSPSHSSWFIYSGKRERDAERDRERDRKRENKWQQHLLFNNIQKKKYFKISHAWMKHTGGDLKYKLLTDHEPKLPFMYLEEKTL